MSNHNLENRIHVSDADMLNLQKSLKLLQDGISSLKLSCELPPNQYTKTATGTIIFKMQFQMQKYVTCPIVVHRYQ